jgi:hypothetical protein
MIRRVETLPIEYRDLTVQLAVLQKDRVFVANQMEASGKSPDLVERDKRLKREIRLIEMKLRYLKARSGMKTRSEFAIRFKRVAREILSPELYQRLIAETNASFRAWADEIIEENGE